MSGIAQHARLLKASLRLTPCEAEQARNAAWDRYANRPNADLRVGRAKYEAEVTAINALEEPMDLKPCPYCGGNPDQPYFGDTVECAACKCSARTTEAWNTRTPDPKAQRLADALEALINSFEKHRPKELWDEARAALAEWKP